jgi:hypothetical protein
MRGFDTSSQAGTCPLVTRWMRRTHGAYFSMLRKLYRSSSLSR